MSKIEVLIILQELGGEATGRQIINRAKSKFPHLSLWRYTGDRLTKLVKDGSVKYDNKRKMWIAVDYSSLYNRNIIQL